MRSTHTFSLTICPALLGNSLAIIKYHRTCFPGPFRIPAQTFSFFSPHYISLCLQNQAPKNVKCHRTVDCRDQTVTERPVRPRVSAPVVCKNTRLCIFVPHPCHFNKIDFLAKSTSFKTYTGEIRKWKLAPQNTLSGRLLHY